RRNGDHLHVTETITAVEAMLGTTRSITSAYGRVIKLPIPPGTQPGECFRLRGQGIVTAKRAGDLFVEIQVEVPKTLTAAQREQIRKAAQDAGLL
ncbi:MAG: DnaJ C-terminal domain-containing protein, partial [Rhodothermales bacterium]|nr:DnaJ C-terminal domain-containing protein [Rhodothermales bacterium]